MMRKYIILALAGCCGWPLITQAAQTTSAAVATPPISDTETLRYLSPAERTQWEEAAKQIIDGTGQVNDGKFYQSRTEDPNDVVKLDIADTHKKGDAMVKAGTALIKAGKAAEDKLRKIAMDKRDAAHQQAAATAAASFSAPTIQWPEAIQSLSEKLLGQLSDEKYTRLYFGGVYAFDEPKYASQPGLADQLRDQLRDQAKNALSSTPADHFTLGEDSGKLIIDYSARSSDAQSGVKAALIIGELLYETRNGYAAFSLRAIDLSNLHIVANQLVMLSVEPTMAKLLGLPAFRVMASRVAPASAEKAVAAATTDTKAADKPVDAPALATAINVNLQDPNDVLAAFKTPAYVFRLATSGHATTLENRFAALMVKSYFLDQQPNVAISDQDFLSMALPKDDGVDATASPADVNTAWLLPNVPDLNVASIDLDALTAQDLNKNASVKIGKITIQRTLPKLSLPSAQELRAAGY